MKKKSIVFSIVFSIISLLGIYTLFSEKSVSDVPDITKLITYEDVLTRSEETIDAAIAGNGYGYLKSAIKEGKKIYLGSEIPTYILGDESIQMPGNFKYYPVFLENEIVGNIIARNVENGQLTLEFLDIFKEQMNAYHTECKPVCMFIDKNSIWLLNEERCTKLFSDNHISKNLGTFSPEMREDIEVKYAIMEKRDEIVFS